jgi:DNA-binding NarL/FixJ family response regulator
MNEHGVRLALQERRRLVRLGLTEVLDATAEIEVVAAVETHAELISAAAECDAETVLFELFDGEAVAELVAALREHAPEVRLIGLHDGRRSDLGRLPATLEINALVSYGSGVDTLVDLVLGRATLKTPQADRRLLPSRNVLTPREREVLEQLAAGKTAADCAAALAVRPKTIDNHKQRIFNKLGVQNQAHAVALAHKMGLFGRSDQQVTAV